MPRRTCARATRSARTLRGLLVAARSEALISTRHLAVRIEDRVIFS